MRVTEIGASAVVGEPEPDGTVVVTVTPWWSHTAPEPGGPSTFRAPLPEFQVPVDAADAASPARLRARIDSIARDADRWLQVVPDPGGTPEDYERRLAGLWRGVDS